jgi:hypothetical protein
MGLALASRKSIILHNWLARLEVFAQLNYPAVRFHLLCDEGVLVHAVSSQDLQNDALVLHIQGPFKLPSVLQEISLYLPQLFNGLNKLSGGHQRLDAHDL